MGATKIEWTTRHLPDGRTVPGYTFNCWIGCTKVSPACDHCYAERDAAARKGLVTWGPHAQGGTRRVTAPDTWRNPERWARAAWREGVRPLVFVASWADVFEQWSGPMLDHHYKVIRHGPAGWVGREGHAEVVYDPAALEKPVTMHEVKLKLFRLIARTAYALDWIVLTKRAEAMWSDWPRCTAEYRTEIETLAGRDHEHGKVAAYLNETGMMPNVWAGVTAESQEWAVRRCSRLVQVPAVRRLVSAEPLVEGVTLDGSRDHAGKDLGKVFNYLAESQEPGSPGIHWVITGGESGGPEARAAHPDWYRHLRDQCKAKGVPFFFKQWGEVIPIDHAAPAGMTLPPEEAAATVPVPAGTGGVNIWSPGVPDGDGGEMAFRRQAKDGIIPLPMLGFRVGKKAAGRVLDGVTHDAIPEGVF